MNDLEISDLEFQISGSSSRDLKGEFTVFIYGATKEGYSVCLTVTEKLPDFYVEIPESWGPTQLRQYKEHLLATVGGKDREKIELTVERHKSFWDFSNNKLFTFLRIQTKTKRLWIQLREICLDKDTMTPIPYNGQTLVVFEANIDPMLRFFHERDITPAGWITVKADCWEPLNDDEPLTSCMINAKAIASDVIFAPPKIQMTTAPFKKLSWDIECTSSHGDFPLANKTWRKPALELVERGIKEEEISAAILAAIEPSYKSNGTNINRIFLSPSATEAVKHIMSRLKEGSERWPSTVDALETKLNKMFPAPEGDPIIQIGACLYIEDKPVRKDIFVLGTADPLPAGDGFTQTVYSCRTESAVIRGFCSLIEELDPDFLVGYNTNNFDNKYLWDRAIICHCSENLAALHRYRGAPVELKAKTLGSSALGDNRFHIFKGEGRLHIDLLAYVKRNATLESYKLDNVTATFMSGSVKSLKVDGAAATLTTKSTKGTTVGRYIVLMDEENDLIGEKLRIVAVTPNALTLEMTSSMAEALAEHPLPPVRWAQAKDDVSPKEIFALHQGGPADRTRIAAYCLQDCDLVMELMQKLEVLNNAIAMANICWVPTEFIFSRGQGIKAESLMFYECRKAGQLIPVLPQSAYKEEGDGVQEIKEIVFNEDDEDGYEGAIVLDPLSGIYTEKEPVAALDFSSLYPSTIMSENLSHDTHIHTKDYDLANKFIRIREGSDTYDNLPNCTYLDVPYNILKPDPADSHKNKRLIVVGTRVCRFVQTVDGKPFIGTLPAILDKLLAQRKATRKLIPSEPDEFRKGLLDAKQLAYKLTANSLYGQMGSATFKVRRKLIAASTTAHGRSQIMFSKAAIEATYGPSAGDPRCSAICVYGDTDSIFISFRPCDPATGERLEGRAAQEAAKALAEEAGHKISGALKRPHDFEFDKMFRCFCLLSKKRYVGDMTEGDRGADGDFIYDRKSMGIAMKRRGNAPVVKYIYGGVIERILVERSISSAFNFAQEATREMVAGKFPLRRFVITKALKSEYKVVPAHKILADRIGSRDPGNRPASNDRLPYVFVMKPDGRPWSKDTGQGDRIETPSYLVERGLKLDYTSYIENQIATPVAEMFALVLEQLPGFKPHLLARAKGPTEHAKRVKVAEDLLFKEILTKLAIPAGQRDIRGFFK